MSKGRSIALGLLLAGTMLAMGSGAMSAQTYKSPKNSYGQPDIGGAWSNSSLTRLERPASYGDRLVMTPKEVADAEGSRAADVEKGNRPTDPNATAQEVNATCDLKGFAPGAGCAYNQGFTEPGDLVMRVHGEPRTSFITYPANGRVPAPKAGAKLGYLPLSTIREGRAAAGTTTPMDTMYLSASSTLILSSMQSDLLSITK